MTPNDAPLNAARSAPMPAASTDRRATWLAPKVRDLGSLRRLVRGASGIIADAGSPTSKKKV